MKDLKVRIYNDNEYVGVVYPSFEKYDSASNIFWIYDVKSNSCNTIKVTVELLKNKEDKKLKEVE